MEQFCISRNKIGAELEKLSLFTYIEYAIFISALVVHKETIENGTNKPGEGFAEMYIKCCGEQRDMNVAVREQQEKAVAEDWSDLLHLLNRELRKNIVDEQF